MTHELIRDRESAEFPARQRIIILDLSADGEGKRYQPLLLNCQAKEPLSLYFHNQLESLHRWLKSFDQKIKRKGAKIHPRPKRERRDILPTLRKLREERLKRLNVLTGKELRPVRVIKKGDEIVGWSIGEFSHEERVWWQLVAYEIPGLIDVVVGDTQLAALLRRGFNLRYRMKYGSTEDKEKALNQWRGDFAQTVRSLDEEVASKIVGPFLRKIAENNKVSHGHSRLE